MIETHGPAEPPAWLRALVEDVVLEAVTPLGFVGPLGYRWLPPGEPANQYDGWQVCVFPTPNEAAGGPHDGCKYVDGIEVDLTAVLGALAAVEKVVWHASVRYNGELDGPEVSIRGQFANRRVWLRLFHVPPSDEPAAYLVDQRTGEARVKA